MIIVIKSGSSEAEINRIDEENILDSIISLQN